MSPSLHVVFSPWTLFCLLAAALLPVVCAGLAKRSGFGKRRSQGGYDNHNPRAWLARQEGLGARANAAQANTFEALPFFYLAVVVATLSGVGPAVVAGFSLAWLALGLAYVGACLADRATLRSLVWMAALGVNAALLLLGVF